MLDIEPFPACLLMTHLPAYHALHHHNQGVIERGTYRLVVKIFLGGEQKVFVEGEQISV